MFEHQFGGTGSITRLPAWTFLNLIFEAFPDPTELCSCRWSVQLDNFQPATLLSGMQLESWNFTIFLYGTSS